MKKKNQTKQKQVKVQVKSSKLKQPLKTSKSGLVIKHLIRTKSITSWEAIEKYKITRLSAIIFLLRKRGWSIESKSYKNADGNFVKYIYKPINSSGLPLKSVAKNKSVTKTK
jgi:hypothetical protein